jgi:hypothetical protein
MRSWNRSSFRSGPARAACLAITSVLALTACDSGVTAPSPESAAYMRGPSVQPPPQAPVVQWTTPTYPAIAIYIVYREYVHLNGGLTYLDPDDRRYQAYMERRLMELYPDQGYPGMMRAARAEARHNFAALERYERDVRAYHAQLASETNLLLSSALQCGGTSADPNAGSDPSWTGEDEYLVPPDEQLPTIEMEIDTLQLVGVEVDNIYYYESLATGTYLADPGDGSGGDDGGGWGGGGGGGGGEFLDDPGLLNSQPTRDDLIRAAAAGHTPYQDEVHIQVNPALIAGITLGVVGWKAFRVKQSADRAIERSATFYPHQPYADTQRDAHRHISWSLMLRRYVGGWTAKTITDNHESDSSGPDHVMDLHNNDIGRDHRYKSFRGRRILDRWDYKLWTRNIRDYISDEAANGVFIPEWRDNPQMSTAEAWAMAACVPADKYIFFRR